MNEATAEYYDNLIIEPQAESAWMHSTQQAWEEAGKEHKGNGSRSQAAREILIEELRDGELDADGILSGSDGIEWEAVANELLSPIEGYLSARAGQPGSLTSQKNY